MSFIYLSKLLFFCLFFHKDFSCCCCGDCGVSEGGQISTSSKINDPLTNLGGKNYNNKRTGVGLKEDKGVHVANFMNQELFNTYSKKNRISKNNNPWKIDKGGDINLTTEKMYESNKDSLYNSFIEEIKVTDDKTIDEITNVIVSHKIGFPNLGNTCYFNCCLQFLTHNYEFVKFVLENIIKIKDTDDKIKNATIAMSFCRLLFFIYNNKDNNLIKSSLLGSILYFFLYKETEGKEGYNNDHKYKEFHLYKQADIDEFLNNFFTVLESELKCSLFAVFLNMVTDCIYAKGVQNQQSNSNYILQLPLENENEELIDLIRKNNNSPEDIKDYKFNDGGKGVVMKQIFYEQESENFLIYLKRYSYNEEKGKAEKIESDVKFGEVIEIGYPESDKKKYKIMSIIVQIGGMDAGHYICYVKIGGKWCLFDDSRLTEFISFNEICNYKYLGYDYSAKKAYFISAKLIEDSKKD